MAPGTRHATNPGRAGPSSSNETDTADLTIPNELADAQAEILQLRAQLQLQAGGSPTTPPLQPAVAQHDRLAIVLETLVQRLPRDGTPVDSSKTTKLPDPPLLTDGKDPTFESWKLQMQGKLQVNHDHFPTPYACMTYVFNRTGGDAQEHLLPRVAGDSPDPFESADEMFECLTAIYVDPFKKQNARRRYLKLMMKPSETFGVFYTQFLHLAGYAGIPQDDLLPDLHSKLTLELRRALITVYPAMKTQREYSIQCLATDQELQEIKILADHFKRNNVTPPAGRKGNEVKAPASGPPTISTPLSKSSITPNYRGGTPARDRPAYSDLETQALSDAGLCFNCKKPGHFAAHCPDKKDSVVQEIDAESGKEQP